MTSPAPTFALLRPSVLRPHEHVDDDGVERLSKQLVSDGEIQRPVVVDEATHVILDGHHRFAALQRLGCRLVPCHLVDYNDPAIRVVRWDDGAPMDKRELVARAMAGELYPIKTSRHTTLRRLPNRATPLSVLGGDDGGGDA